MHSASSMAAKRMRVGRNHDDRVSSHERRCQPRDEPVERRLVRCEERHHAGRLGDGEVEVRTRNGIRRPEHLGELVSPARVPDHAIDRGLDLVTSRAHPGQPLAARLHRLCKPIQHLTAVVGGRCSPARERLARRDHRFACILPRAKRNVVPLALERPARFGPRERTADEQLVRLADRQPCHRTLRRRTSGTPRARDARLRGRIPTPCSRRTARPDRSG